MLILSTSAELNLMNEMRTNEYLKTIEWLQENASTHNVVWLECILDKEPAYLKGVFPCYCSNTHNPNYINQGSNHGQSLKKFFNDYKVNDDLVVQLTGRYHFMDSYFFDQIEKNPGYDFYGKSKEYDQYFTGCFAIKKNYLIQWLNETDWEYLNYAMINFEKSLWNFVKENKLNCFELDSLHMDCNIFAKGNIKRIEI